MLYRPEGSGPFPAIVYNHGSAPGMLSQEAFEALGPVFARRGWVFFGPYRRGQGLSAAAGPYIGDEIAAAQKRGGISAGAATMVRLLETDHLNDQLAALAWLRRQSFVRPDRIAVAGNSFGGIETVLGAEREQYCAAIDSAGGAQSWAEAPELQALMTRAVRRSRAPIFFFQAANDYDLSPSRTLSAAMKDAGNAYEMKIYPAFGKSTQDGHAFGYFGSSVWADDVFRFLDNHCAQTFKSGIEEVAVSVTVHNSSRAPGIDLRQEDFRVFDDGRPVPISVFAKSRRQAQILLLLDTSSSMTGSLANLESAVHSFLARLAPDDVIRLGTFSDRLRLSPTFVPLGDQSLAHLPIAPGSNLTVLYDALVDACDAFDGGDGRRVIVVVSDGADTASTASAQTVMQRSTVAGVTVYAIGLNSRFVERGKSVVRAPDPALREIAEDSGGGYVFGEKSSDLERLFAPIIDELHQQYWIGFAPAHADGRIHSLAVGVKRPDVQVRARKHYFARQ